MSPQFPQSFAFSPLVTMIVVALSSLMLLPLTSTEITNVLMNVVDGTAMPASWCPLSNYTVPDITADRTGSVISCSWACMRTEKCKFYCIIGSVCATFSSQVAPYFQGWPKEPDTVYDFCYTTWPGDPLNIVTPDLKFDPSESTTASSDFFPEFVADGFMCENVAPGFKSIQDPKPYFTIDLGEERKVSVLKYVVVNPADLADLRIKFGNLRTFVQNEEIFTGEGEPTGAEEVLTFNPPKSGQYLTFSRAIQGSGQLFIGEVTIYE